MVSFFSCASSRKFAMLCCPAHLVGTRISLESLCVSLTTVPKLGSVALSKFSRDVNAARLAAMRRVGYSPCCYFVDRVQAWLKVATNKWFRIRISLTCSVVVLAVVHICPVFVSSSSKFEWTMLARDTQAMCVPAVAQERDARVKQQGRPCKRKIKLNCEETHVHEYELN